MRPATIRLRIRDLALAVLFLSVFGVLVTLTYLIAPVAGAVAGVLFLASAIAFRWVVFDPRPRSAPVASISPRYGGVFDCSRRRKDDLFSLTTTAPAGISDLPLPADALQRPLDLPPG